MAAPQHSMNKFSSAFGLHINSDLRGLLIVNIKDMMEAAEVEDFLHIFIHIADDDFSSLLFAAFLKLHEETQARRTDILQFLAVDDKYLIGKIGYAVQNFVHTVGSSVMPITKLFDQYKLLCRAALTFALDAKLNKSI